MTDTSCSVKESLSEMDSSSVKSTQVNRRTEGLPAQLEHPSLAGSSENEYPSEELSAIVDIKDNKWLLDKSAINNIMGICVLYSDDTIIYTFNADCVYRCVDNNYYALCIQ